jgi:ABC-type transport system involved in multi-copper enzyme maturation permease subunit
MLWQKSWWETRLLFWSGLVSMLLLYGLTFRWGFYDPAPVVGLLHRSESQRQVLKSYQGQMWAVWYELLFNFAWADFAAGMGIVCLGTAFPSMRSRGQELFTLSLPVSRRKALLSQAAVGFGEAILVAIIPSLLLPIIARFQGQWFSWSDTLIYMSLAILGGAIFFCFAFLLTVILGKFPVAILLSQVVVFALFLPSLLIGERPWWNILGVMAGESYFFHGRIPWTGLVISLAVSVLMMFAAVRIYERRDF